MAWCGVQAQKREFRGAWIQAVNGQFTGMSRDAMQQNLTHQLDVLQQDGVNAIIFHFMKVNWSRGVVILQGVKVKHLILIGTLWHGWSNSAISVVWSFMPG